MRPTLTLALLLAAVSPRATALAKAPGSKPPAVPVSTAAPPPSEVEPIPVNPTPHAPAPPEAPAAPAPTEESVPEAPMATQDTPREPSPAAELLPVVEPARHTLVHGAPLMDPNVSVHVVQRKRFEDEGRHELALYPLVGQLNGRFTQHTGSALRYVYHVQENFALMLDSQYNWYANESDFNLELIDKVREQAQAATSLLLAWGVQGGVEVTPLYGKFAFYDDFLAQFSVVLHGGAGLGGTRALIRPEVANQVDGISVLVPARYGDTGSRFVGSIGGGFRVQLGSAFSLRLEVRDVVYTARVDRVDGCSLSDFDAMETARTSGQPFSELPLSGSCRYARYDGVDPRTRKNYREDIILARDLVSEPSSDVLNTVGFYAGFSFVF